MNYGLYKKMEIFVGLPISEEYSILTPQCDSQRAKPATKREMTQFHSDDYVDFLSRINPNNVGSYQKEQHKCGSCNARHRTI